MSNVFIFKMIEPTDQLDFRPKIWFSILAKKFASLIRLQSEIAYHWHDQ